MAYIIREMGLGDILDQAIKLVRNHFKTLFLICCCVYLPTLLIQGLFGMGDQQIIESAAKNGPEQMSDAIMPVLMRNGMFTLLLLLIAMPITNAAITYAIAEEYLGRPSNVKGSLGKALGRILPLIGTSIIGGLFIFFGLIFLIVPGIIIAFGLILSSQVVVLEGISGLAALNRSWTLMKGNKGKAFLLNLVLALIGGAAGGIAGAFNGASPLLAALLTAVVQTLALMLGAAAFVVLYFSARCKHEQFDMMLLAQWLGNSTPAPAPVPDEPSNVLPR